MCLHGDDVHRQLCFSTTAAVLVEIPGKTQIHCSTDGCRINVSNESCWRDIWHRQAPVLCRDQQCCSDSSYLNSDTACILPPYRRQRDNRTRERKLVRPVVTVCPESINWHFVPRCVANFDNPACLRHLSSTAHSALHWLNRLTNVNLSTHVDAYIYLTHNS